MPRLPVVFWVNIVCVEPSPQSTSTLHGASGPGSVNEPRLMLVEAPSLAFWSAGAVTVGATLATSTTWTDSESVAEAPSESCTFILTCAVLGPSGKKHLKLPPCVVGR